MSKEMNADAQMKRWPREEERVETEGLYVGHLVSSDRLRPAALSLAEIPASLKKVNLFFLNS